MEDLTRRTTSDAVYEKLHDEIVSLEILPGTKLSETEVARRFGVSRQPVRNAFTKLGNEDLLVIRPQKATEVRGFSMERVALARLVRMAVELEVVYRAVKIWDASREEQLAENLALQEKALRDGDLPAFHALDYDFHKLIYVLGGNPLAFEVMLECKQKVDRLCLLSLEKDSEAESILADHRDIAKGMASGNLKQAQDSIRKHLSRLDETIDFVHKTHPKYFE
ncbi:GntR family transcriptional regulator [uncultured Litoreibacter sp.]|uniref:GntR family transcriptional regulator n=1 Tax=uncultured Litoreibacter sp. TaxID=1392394 RepID=UPI0026185B28|nr:GntR family transcriptional regulator [uncultured Litoreibacter sp.]